jgi:hypothetical protein
LPKTECKPLKNDRKKPEKSSRNKTAQETMAAPPEKTTAKKPANCRIKNSEKVAKINQREEDAGHKEKPYRPKPYGRRA